jgi:hypothetical protein
LRYSDSLADRILDHALWAINMRGKTMSAFRKYASLGGLLAMFCITSSGAIAAEEKIENISGYLGPEIYAKLVDVEIKDGRKTKRWVGPKLSFANYKTVLIEDVILYPEPEPGPQVSQETLDAVTRYSTEKIKEKIGEVLNLASEPGPGVLRVQPAITGVKISTEGMKAYEVMPVAAIFGGLKAMTGNRAQEVILFVEVKLSDSETGEVVGAAVRRLEGKKLKGKKDQLQLEDLAETLDTATDDAHDMVTEFKGEEE